MHIVSVYQICPLYGALNITLERMLRMIIRPMIEEEEHMHNKPGLASRPHLRLTEATRGRWWMKK